MNRGAGNNGSHPADLYLACREDGRESSIVGWNGCQGSNVAQRRGTGWLGGLTKIKQRQADQEMEICSRWRGRHRCDKFMQWRDIGDSLAKTSHRDSWSSSLDR